MKTQARGYTTRRRLLGLSPALMAVLAMLVLFGGLWAAGFVDPAAPFKKKPMDTRGLIAVPVSAVTIPAHTKILRDHFWNPKAGSFAVIYLKPAQVSPDIIVNISSIIGRVMGHDKPASYAFTESDFLPVGTRPGLVAGIPPGKRAMRIPVDRVPGLVGLAAGDRFDLVATLPLDPSVASGAVAGAGGGVYGGQLELQARLSNWQKQATVKVVVQAGDVVQPLQTRTIPVASNTMSSGMVIQNKPVQEVVIAVNPSEVARLTESLAVGADIQCVPRSGRPEDPTNSKTPGLAPSSPFAGATTFGSGFASVETISGNSRQIVATPVKR